MTLNKKQKKAQARAKANRERVAKRRHHRREHGTQSISDMMPITLAGALALALSEENSFLKGSQS